MNNCIICYKPRADFEALETGIEDLVQYKCISAISRVFKGLDQQSVIDETIKYSPTKLCLCSKCTQELLAIEHLYGQLDTLHNGIIDEFKRSVAQDQNSILYSTNQVRYLLRENLPSEDEIEFERLKQLQLKPIQVMCIGDMKQEFLQLQDQFENNSDGGYENEEVSTTTARTATDLNFDDIDALFHEQKKEPEKNLTTLDALNFLKPVPRKRNYARIILEHVPIPIPGAKRACVNINDDYIREFMTREVKFLKEERRKHSARMFQRSLRVTTKQFVRPRKKEITGGSMLPKTVERRRRKWLVKSREIGNSEKQHKCTVEDCPYTTLSKPGLIMHLSTFHKIKPDPARYKCTICNKNNDNQYKLRLHMESHEVSKKKEICEICGSIFKTRSGLRSHRLNAHNTGEAKFKCTTCGKGFMTDSSLQTHISSVHLKEKVICQFCSREFSRKQTLNEHIETKHSNPDKFYCSRIGCDKLFDSEHEFQDHFSRHEMIVKCPQCDKSYSSDKACQRHIETYHSSNLDYECTICKKRFAKGAVLKLHLKSHDRPEEMQFQCHICEYTTFQKQKYDRHIRTHQKRWHIMPGDINLS